MGKGRGKGKKQSVVAKLEEPGIEEDKVSAYRRSGRQQKSQKDEIVGVEKASGNTKEVETMEVNNSSTEDKRKRKRSALVKEKIDEMKEENAIRTDDSTKPAGFRQNGSRRKNKPRRAAEAGVDCNLQSEIFV
ncbi:uncharacterized protein LOC129300551 [Prosopis cineraria]|uniref:uncharacterized protein LOC129300551 n=1 Tax=Prosopis cineraria TaxID=364024 RepID=UPI00240FC836|nr:uncharacterized protein LOC129300551 [Prosopis cineraria]XP_054795099.1 uncharacterized protein LOC129300551 [Prosopis cineraria]